MCTHIFARNLTPVEDSLLEVVGDTGLLHWPGCLLHIHTHTFALNPTCRSVGQSCEINKQSFSCFIMFI